MASKPPVHVEPRESGWAVVREGNERATSVHATQAEAAKEGRNIARREETEFFLHAQDGRIREHNSYGEASYSEKEEAVGHAAPGAQEVAHQEATGSEKVTGIAQEDHQLSGDATDDAEEGHALAAEQRDDHFATLQERFTGYEVYDVNGERIGKIDYLFVDENDQLEYIGVKTGVLGAKAILIPMAVVRVDDERRIAEVNAVKTMIEEGPAFGSDEEITPEFEWQIHNYYGIEGIVPSGERAACGTYYASEDRGGEEADPRPSESLRSEERRRGAASDTVNREREERQEHLLEEEGFAKGEDELIDSNELRVQRAEEELVAGTREREAGAVRVRKRVVTERRREEIPTRREEVHVDRVPVEEVAAEAEIGEQEVVIPVTEEEVVVEKRPVAKEEVRIRKEIVEDTETVEEGVRREEVEVDDQTERRNQ